MQVDFYQLDGLAPESVIASLSEKVIASGERLLVVSADEVGLARLDRLLWAEPAPTSFLPHGLAGGPDDARQPILLSTSPDAPNGARHMLIADGEWRDAALAYDRAFFIFDGDGLEAARLAWKLLAGREGVERYYWANDGGRWVQKA